MTKDYQERITIILMDFYDHIQAPARGKAGVVIGEKSYSLASLLNATQALTKLITEAKVEELKNLTVSLVPEHSEVERRIAMRLAELKQTGEKE